MTDLTSRAENVALEELAELPDGALEDPLMSRVLGSAIASQVELPDETLEELEAVERAVHDTLKQLLGPDAKETAESTAQEVVSFYIDKYRLGAHETAA